MGVRNLYTLLHPFTTPETFPATTPTPLFIDGPALTHHIYHLLHPLSPPSHAFTSQIPYHLFTTALLSYLSHLTASGFQIQKIYFDGALPDSKIPVRLERLDEGLRKLQTYRSATPVLRDGGEGFGDGKAEGFWRYEGGKGVMHLTAPPFIVCAAMRVLRGHAVYGGVTFTVQGEADSYLARDAVGDSAVVLTGDSDLLVYPTDSRRGVLMLRDLTFTSTGATGAVFRPRDIADNIGAEIIDLAYQLSLDPAVGLSVVKQRLERVKARKAAGVGEEGGEKEWRLEYTLPAPGGERPCLEPRISEFLHLPPSAPAVMYLPVLWEDPQRASAWEVGALLRASAYLRPVTEIRRKGQRITRVEIPSSSEPVEADVKTILRDIFTLSNPPLSIADLAAVAEALMGTTQREKRGLWNWHRVHLFAMASAGWYSLLMHRAITGTGEEMGLLEPRRFINAFEGTGGEAIRLAKEIKKQVKEAERMAEAAEEEAELEADITEEQEPDEEEVQPVVVELGKGGKRKSLGDEGGGRKKGRGKTVKQVKVTGGGNMFAALA